MKTKHFLLVTLALGFVSPVAWAQSDDRQLIISPRLADSDDPITITVTNSRCYYGTEVFPPKGDDHSATVRLMYAYSSDEYRQCLQDPDASDFETTLGPLESGEYSVALSVYTGGIGPHLVDSESLSVIDAPPAATLSDGGINGLYHRPDSPHQYFYVLETVYTTLLVWNTFDAEGNQLWVYGVGDLFNGGQTVVTEAYINRSVGFFPNGEPEIEAEAWGVIRLDMTSCKEGTVRYKSDLPEFEDGEFDIVRLAYSKQIGCVDQ